jgi:hypothetical protein
MISGKNSYNFLNNKNYYCSESELKNWKKKFLVDNNNNNNNKYAKIKNTKIKQINIPKTPTKKRNVNYNKNNTNISPKKNICLTPIRYSKKFSNNNINKINKSNKNNNNNNNNFNNINIDINEFMQKLKEKTKTSNFSVSDFINSNNNNNIIDETHITTTDVSTNENNNNNNKNNNKSFIKNTSLNSNDLNYTDDDENNNNNDLDEFPNSNHINNINNNLTKKEKDEINSQQILYKKKYDFYLNELKKYSNLINIDKIFEIYNEKNDIEININKIEKYIRKNIPNDASKFLDIFIELLGYEIRFNNNNKILNENL